MMTHVVMITGAAGFVGRHTVDEARKRGHKVCAVVRSAKNIPKSWENDAGIVIVVCDLATDTAVLGSALNNVDSVIHIAASLSGDDTVQQRDTIKATENILAGIEEQSKPVHLVLASTISVYDTMSVRTGGIVDEQTKLEPNAAKRDAYCRAKLLQETICRNANIAKLSILRIGAVFGRGRIWNSHIGIGIGPVLLRIGGQGELPLCYVRHCAKALVLAVENPAAVVNVVDDNLPDRATFIADLQKTGWSKIVVPLSWKLLDLLALAARPLPVSLPGLLRKPVLHARMKPLKYSNARLHKQLGWTPDCSFEQAMQEAKQ